MYKKLKVAVALGIISVLLSVGSAGYCASYEFESGYTASNTGVWSKRAGTKYSGGAYLALDTSKASENGYYVDYTVNVQKNGAYCLTIDCSELGGNVYCEVYVSVNDGKMYNLYTNTGVEIAQSSGLGRVTMTHLPGFKAGNNKVRFTVLNPRPRDTRYIAYLDCFSLEKADFGIQNVEITGDAAYNVVEQGKSVGAVFNFSEASSAAETLNVTVGDYFGKEVFSKDYAVKAGAASVTADFGALAKGHYTITAKMSGKTMSQTFVSVVTPLNRRIQFSDTPFGIDAAFSILAPREKIDDNLKAFKLTGATWMRDRLVLSAVSGNTSKWNFSGTFADEVMTKASNLGIKTHAMIQSMPTGLLDTDSKNNSESISSDYISLYNFGKQLAEYYSGRVTTFEIFNEPDTRVGSSDSETGDKFANFVKAIAMGVYDSGTGAGVTAPGYAAVKKEPLELGIRSGMFDYVDVGTYHSHQTYSTEFKTQSLKMNPTNNFNDLIRAYGYTDKNTWLDETGISMGPSDNSSLEASIQRKQASYCIMSVCEGLYKGADKIFSYLFNDSRSRFSWFSRYNEGPNRIYTAYSVMTDVLGEGECLGMVDYFDGAEGYIFKNGARQILVMRSDSQKDIEIPTSAASVEVIKADGNSVVKFPKNGSVKVGISADPVFVAVTGKYDETLYTSRNRKLNDFEADIKNFSGAGKIILHQTYPTETRTNAKYEGYQIGDTATVTVKVSNLNSTAKQGVIYAETFSGWEISPATQNVIVTGNGTKSLKFTITRTDDVVDNHRSAVVFRGKFGDEYTADCVTEIVHTGEVKYRQISSITDLLNVSQWKKSACAGATTTIAAAGSGISFKFDFPVSASDKWSYPHFTFSNVQDFSKADGILIRYSLPKSFADYEKLTCSVWLGEKDGGRYVTSIGEVLEAGENVWLIPFSDFTHRNGVEIDDMLTTDNINYFSVGVNSKGDCLDVPKLTIKDIGLFRVESEEESHSKVSSAKFLRPDGVNSKYGCIKIAFSDADIDVDLSSVKVTADGEACECVKHNEELFALLPRGAENGEHKISVSYSCKDTKAFYEELKVKTKEVAVWKDDIPSVWYTEDRINSECEYSFEIAKAGYYSLYTSHDKSTSGASTGYSFNIENEYTMTLENAAKMESTGEVYYEFDSVYLPQGEYKLIVSKTDDGDVALNGVGIVCDYEVAVRVEGESYNDITFPNKGTATSSGREYLFANSPDTTDGKSFSVIYRMTVPTGGDYTFCAVTAPTDSLYYSPYKFVIDDKIIINSHYAEKGGADVGSLRTYMYGDVYLESGTHTVKAVVENRREKGNPLSYYFWLDAFELRRRATSENAEYKYVSFELENLSQKSISPYMYWRGLGKDGIMNSIDMVSEKALAPGEATIKKFTVKNSKSELKNIYIWDEELTPLCKSIIYD